MTSFKVLNTDVYKSGSLKASHVGVPRFGADKNSS